MNSGLATPKRVKQLEALLAVAPAEVERPADLAKLTQADALALITTLRGMGVKPPPSPEQLSYIRNMAEKLGLSDEDAAALIDLADLDALTTGEQASELIGLLKTKVDEELPASPKQQGLIRSLAKKLGLEEADAAALVEAPDFAALTGGRSGTASALIDALRARERAAKAAAAEAPTPSE